LCTVPHVNHQRRAFIPAKNLSRFISDKDYETLTFFLTIPKHDSARGRRPEENIGAVIVALTPDVLRDTISPLPESSRKGQATRRAGANDRSLSKGCEQ
jgi:hypothetical protein